MTYGQLVDAANARRSEAWDTFSVLLSLTYNANRGQNAPAMTPDDWHPMRRTNGRERRTRRDNAKIIRSIHDQLVATGAPVRVLQSPKVVED